MQRDVDPGEAGPPGTVPWRGASYARASGHHRQVDDWFLRRWPPNEDDVVVDLGCGTGEFTAALAEMVRRGRVVGVDQDESMLAVARRHVAPNLFFASGRAEQVDRIVEPGSVDMVVSRAMLHWLPPDLHLVLYRAVLQVLKAGGVFHLEAGAPGNVPAIMDLLKDMAHAHGVPPPQPFPDPGRALERLEQAGFVIAEDSVQTVAQRRPFTREQLVDLLRTQAVLVLTRHADQEQARSIADQAVEAVELLRRHDGSYDQTFVRLELLVRRPG